MSSHKHATRTVPLSEANHTISVIFDEVRQDRARVLVEENGIPVAAIISAADLERFVHYERQRAERFKILDEIREAFKDVPDEEIERETDRIVAEIRAGTRAARETMAATREQEQEPEALWAIIDRMREAFKDTPDEEIEREADRAVAEIRGKIPANA